MLVCLADTLWNSAVARALQQQQQQQQQQQLKYEEVPAAIAAGAFTALPIGSVSLAPYVHVITAEALHHFRQLSTARGVAWSCCVISERICTASSTRWRESAQGSSARRGPVANWKEQTHYCFTLAFGCPFSPPLSPPAMNPYARLGLDPGPTFGGISI